MSAATDALRLGPLTTLRLGGPAAGVVEARTADELVAAVRAADEAGEPVLVLAGGSNVVIADEGFPGVVVRVLTRGVEEEDLGERVRLTVAAGEPWDEVVARAVRAGLAGFECLSGIPGSTGATPMQNVGAYGQEVASTIESVMAYDRAAREVVELPSAECGFVYRGSRFRHTETHVILSVTFLLRRSARSEPIRYAELARALGVAVDDRVPLAAAREAVLRLRRGKGMVVDPGDPESVSAGSFFTNPVLDMDAFAALEARVRARLGGDAAPPRFDEPGGRVKTSAAWLIERAGFGKGLRRGRVGLSAKHTLALVNRGGATSAELLALAREIAGGVRAAFAVDLVPEPVLVGLTWDAGAGEALPVIEFGTPGASRERLVDLVVAGTKRATASLWAEWEADGDALSEPGSRWAVVRTDGTRACVVEITDVRVAPLRDVEPTFHVDEGEGDASREDWIAGHLRFWEAHVVPGLRAADPSFELGPETPVVFERFRVVG